MAFNKALKFLDLTTESEIILLSEGDTEQVPNPERILKELAHNFVTVNSFDSSGQPANASAGTYDVYVELVDGGGFAAVEGSIDATKTGGDALVSDGDAQVVSFDANPCRIKVIANGVAGVEQAAVIVNQNAT